MIHVSWIDRGCEPAHPSNPNYPDGIDLDLTRGAKPFCQTGLPYPAERCGYFTIACDVCGFTTMVTTAGRPEDPKSIKLPCQIEPVKWR
ncbi:hypothetical protein AAFX91_30100 [Bradyrhizobium sp. 31Argb]|uniref:hypothetical protein n=1 Tax=Bradyrhizobium TaxID=374 RepID=UPI000425B66A|nr:hypothetical protein [Bradyrhizobium elkanii]